MWPSNSARDAALAAATARLAMVVTWPQGRDLVVAATPTPWPGASSIAAARAAAGR